MQNTVMKLNLKIVFTIAFALLQSQYQLSFADIYIDLSDEEISISNVNILENYSIKMDEQVSTNDRVEDKTNTATKNISALPYHQYVTQASKIYSIDPLLIHAVIAVESNHNPHAKSSKGAYGLMQLMPQTSRHLKVKNRLDSKQNIMAGTQYLRELLNKFDGDISLTLAAYNAGPATVMKYGKKIPPYKETQAYIHKVMRFYHQHS
jgi:soluble lytic murein transglycosylase-like protein